MATGIGSVEIDAVSATFSSARNRRPEMQLSVLRKICNVSISLDRNAFSGFYTELNVFW
jgi:hypothetical protein